MPFKARFTPHPLSLHYENRRRVNGRKIPQLIGCTQLHSLRLPAADINGFGPSPNVGTIAFDTKQELLWVGDCHVGFSQQDRLYVADLGSMFSRATSHRLPALSLNVIRLSRPTMRPRGRCCNSCSMTMAFSRLRPGVFISCFDVL